MTAQTQTRFDFDHLKRSMESWDVEALLELYADDVEQIEMDDATPPAAPRVRHKSDLVGIFRHCHDAAIDISLDNPVVGDDRLACTITCRFDGGRRVVANSIMDLRDGRIVRQLDVQARDLAIKPEDVG
jgi:SnoaL-like domain